jgi:LmbE family N-acetylglucosaminyl deacetylase
MRKSGFGNDPDAVTRLRHREETAFAARIGARLTYLHFPEVALRTGSQDIFAEGTAATGPRELKMTVRRLFDRLRPRCIFAPLGIGGHRDHLIARDLAAQEALRRKVLLFYYEDLPYVAGLTPSKVRAHARSVDASLRATQVSIDIAAKVNNLTLYRSQVTAAELRIVSDYARQSGAGQPVERLWTAASKSDLSKIFHSSDDLFFEAPLGKKPQAGPPTEPPAV